MRADIHIHIYVCICAYLYIHIHDMFVYIHTYIYAQIHTYVHLWILRDVGCISSAVSGSSVASQRVRGGGATESVAGQLEAKPSPHSDSGRGPYGRSVDAHRGPIQPQYPSMKERI